MNKKTTVLVVVLCLLLALNAILHIRKNNDPVKAVEESVIEQELERSRQEAHYLRMKADSALLVAESLEDEIAIIQRKSKQTNANYIKDIATWRALPDDERVHFFTEELAKVDTIAGW